MSRIMDELMAEANRVKALENEVSERIKIQTSEVNVAREEKLESIILFLNDMCNAVVDAGVVRVTGNYDTDRHDAFRVPTNINYIDEKGIAHPYILGLGRLKNGGVHVYYGDADYNYDRLHPQFKYLSKTFIYPLIDGWNDETNQQVEIFVAEAIKAKLAERIENATEKLHKANNTYSHYYGKEDE